MIDSLQIYVSQFSALFQPVFDLYNKIIFLKRVFYFDPLDFLLAKIFMTWCVIFKLFL